MIEFLDYINVILIGSPTLIVRMKTYRPCNNVITGNKIDLSVDRGNLKIVSIARNKFR